jgi:ferredoxin
LGVQFKFRTRVGVAISMQKIHSQFDAVFVAVGQLKPGDAEALSLTGADKIAVDSATYATLTAGVFAGGDAVRKRKLTVRSVADGKEAAWSIRRFLLEQGSHPQASLEDATQFNSRMGKVDEGEMTVFLESANREGRREPAAAGQGFTSEEARAEAMRCLHCDCRKGDACLLRKHADTYDARQARYKTARRRFVQQTQHPQIIYEPGKCIDCGVCIQIAAQAGESLGLAFVGRGFGMRVAVPFDASLAEGLKIAAQKCADACPTGALSLKGV